MLISNSSDGSNLALVDPVADCETRNAAKFCKFTRCQIVLSRFGLIVGYVLFYHGRNNPSVKTREIYVKF